MDNLTQQLEDKKKELEQDKALGIGNRIYRLKSEIAILEQAIAEMQKQRQEEIAWLVSLNHDLKECNIENIYPTEGYRIDEWIKKRIEQLNQPKTEK